MATATKRRPARPQLTEEERQERIDALNAELAEAVENLATSEAWVSMLKVSARFRRYSLNNQLLLWAVSEKRGITLTRVAAVGTWRKLGYWIRKGERGLPIYEPVKSRLRAGEVAKWQQEGKNPFDETGKPKIVVRGFKVGYVFDVSQVVPGTDPQPLPEERPWVEQRGSAPDGLWSLICQHIYRAGFQLEYRPSVASDDQAKGWTDYYRRIIWINANCDEAESVRIGAHEIWGHVGADHEHRRDVSRAQRETEADSIAFVVLAALGMRIDSSSVEYVADWSKGNADLLRESAETVHKVANRILSELPVMEN